MKIIDKIQEQVKDGKTFFSFEFFPPRTEEGVENLFERLGRMVAYGPIFCDITWGAGGSTADVTLDIAKRMQNQVCIETMMHLTCTNMPVEKLDSALEEVRKAGLQNILALRGDPPKGQEKFEAIEGGFSCALDLVHHIRKTHGDYFGICVAGYPEAHPDTIVEDPTEMDKNYWANIAYLKQKVEAGGELIITQLFYDVDIFLKFVKDCRSVGITAPIIPGIMPIMTYGGFKRMTGFCKTKVPAAIEQVLEANKDNEEAIKNYGVELGYEMCKRLLAEGTPGLHMYSLNSDKSVLGILERLGFIDTSKVPRPLPWYHTPAGTRRGVEGVRPIYWQYRPKAYLRRTQDWPAYPTSRWSESSHPAYAPLAEPQLLRRLTHSEPRRAKARAAWGETLSGYGDIASVFERYYQGEINLLPWSEVDGCFPSSLQPALLSLVRQGLLPINAQPRVNGASSTDAAAGWGPAGGRVYQKAYLEVFASPDSYGALKATLDGLPGVSYLAAKASGPVEASAGASGVTTLSWGVFPGSEVVAPTVSDPSSFSVWREEAFELWTAEWGSAYEEGSASRALLKDIANTWYLVSIVDNDYVGRDLFAALTGAGADGAPTN